jgi:hypothetical protein
LISSYWKLDTLLVLNAHHQESKPLHVLRDLFTLVSIVTQPVR